MDGFGVEIMNVGNRKDFVFIITNTMHTIGVDKITLFKNHLKQRIISYMFRSSLDHHQGGLYLIREATT